MALGSGNIEIDVSARVDTQGIVRQVNDAQRQINRNPVNLTLNEKGFTQPLGRISGDIAEFQKSLDASVARTLAFGAAVGVLNSVANGFKAMVKDAVEVEKTLADINVILNLSSNSLLKFSDDLFQVAKNTGQTFQSVSEAAIELSRQGLGAEETLKRINDAMILTRLSGMEAAKSVETLTAAVNSFGSTALSTTELVNKLATVDAAFAVSTEDLANALARAGSTAQGAKVSLDELLASVTSVQQITARGGSVIGNAFKSIFTRIQRAGVREALEEIGVATTDAAGNIRGALDIIKDYAGVYSTLTDAQRAYTDELVAGVFQINNFKALVKDLSSDYSIYERALKQSNGATDEAVRRNEQLQSTLASLINESAANVKQLSAALGDLVATPAIENLLTIFNKLSGALAGALEGEGIIKNIFEGIGKFISGPGLVLISVAFIKLFKFITGQAGGALKAVFNIGAAKDRIVDAESKIGLLLQGNKALYEAITNEALDNRQKQELVLNTIKAQNQAYQQQQALISNIARSSAVQTSLSGVNAASGYVPNFANGVEGAIVSEKEAIRAGTGGVSKGAKPKVLKNFPMGGGKKETIVANTDEVIIPNYGGGEGSAIFNKDMIKKSGGTPQGAIPVSRGFVPNFIKGKKRGGAGPNATSKIGFLGTEAYRRAGDFFDGEKPNLDFERVVGGIGIISAKGKSGSITKSEIQNPTSGNFLGASGTREIVDQIGGSKLNDAEKSELVKRLGRKGKVRFSNIGSASLSGLEEGQTANQLAGRAGSINDVIGPYIANATAAVAQKIYGNLFGDEVKAQNLVGSVFNAATTQIDKIATVSTEGSILEAAIRLGSQQSAANFGGDAEATWDFEEAGPISPDLKSLFFDPIGYGNIRRADAKRVGSDAAVTEVVKKAYDTPEMLERLKAFHSRQFSPLVQGAIAGKQQKNAAGGFIPNFGKRGPKRKNSAKEIEAWAQRARKENSQSKEYQNSERMSEQYGMNRSFFVNYLTGQKKMPADFFEPASQEKALQFKNDFLDLSVNNKYKNAAKLTEELARENKTLSGSKLSKYILGKTTLKNAQFVAQALSPDTDTSKKVRKILGQGKFNSFIENINKIKKDSSDNDAMALHFEAGHKFEEALSILGGVPPEKNPDALDFSRTKGRRLGFDPNIAKTIGLDNRKGYGDAHKGRGHGPKKMEEKIIRELDEANTLYRILGFAREGDMSLYSKANLKSHPFPDIVAQGKDGIKTSSRTFGSLYEANKKAFDKLVQKKYGKPYSQLQEREKKKLNKRNINFTYATDDVNFDKINLHGNKKGMKEVRQFLKLEKEVETKAGGFIPNFSLFAEPLPGDSGRSNQLDHFEKNSYGAYDSTLNIRSFFPKSGSSAIGNLFKDVISMADSGNPYTKIEAGEVVGPRIPKMLVMAKKLLDRKRAAGLNQPPMSIEGFMEPFGLLATMGRNKRWYEAEKQIAESKGGKFKPSNPGTGINKAPLSAKYVPAEEKTLLGSLRQLGLTVDERDPSGGFKKFDRYYLKNLPLFKGGFAGGYIPNFPKLQGMGKHSGVYDAKGKSGARSLNIGYLSSVGSSGPQIFKNLLKQFIGAAEEGNPYTEVNAGEIVGPRIPTVILKAKKILDRQRASGKNIPFMNVRGVMDPPARLLEKLKGNKLGLGGKTSSAYVKGEEKQLLQSFKELGLNPESWEMRDLNTIPMLKNFASGYIPNFVNALEESIAREKEALQSQGSSAKIYVDKDDRVKGPNNPMGLLVANTRDEPRDGSQGVNRAIANNIDPKRSGSARGIIPNFIAGAGISGHAASQKMQMAAELSSKFSGVDSTVDSFSGLVDELEELDDQTKENKKLLQDLVLTFKDLHASGGASIEQLSELGTLIDSQLGNAENYQTELKGGSSNQESIDFERSFNKQENVDARDFLKDEGIELQDSDLSKAREGWIKEYNALVDTITSGANELDLPDEELAREFEKLNKVKDKLTKSGVNIETALSTKKLKTVDLGERSEQLSPKLSSGAQDLLKTSNKAASALEKQAKAQDKLGRSSGDAMAKIFGIQFALSQLSALTDFDTTGFQSTVGIIQGIESVAPQAFDKIGDAIGGLVGKAGPYGQILQAGIVAAGIGYDVYRQFFDAEQLAIKELEKEIETRKDAIDVISKNIEKVDQFATSAAKFGESVKAGDIEATGKFMQQIFDSAQDVASLDPKTFENVIASLGDAEKLNKSIGEFKEAAEASRALKQSEQDIANIFKEITTQVDDAQFLGIDFSDGVKAIDDLGDAIGILPPQAYLYKAAFEKFNKDIAIDYSQFAEQFQQIGRSLAQKVSSENLRPLAESLNGLSINSSNAYDVISSLSPAIGELDEATKKKLATDGRVASEVLKQLNIQIQYKAAVQKAKEAFEQSVKPINKLDDNLNKLAKALSVAADASQNALKTFEEIGKIEAAGRVGSLEARSTIGQGALARGTADANIENSLRNAAREQSNALQKFASNILQVEKEGVIELSGSIKNTLSAIQSGSVSNEKGLKLLLDIQKNGTTEEKDIAEKTIEELRKINSSQINSAKIIEANLKAQIKKQQDQAVSFQRNTSISEAQLDGISSLRQDINRNQSSQAIIQQIAKQNEALKLLADAGADEEILGAMKESNKQLNQLSLLKALAQGTTGEGFESQSLGALEEEINSFIKSDSFNQLAEAAKTGTRGVLSAVQTALKSIQDAGVKGEDAAKEAALVTFDQAAVNSLTSEMAKAVSDGLASALGIGPELAKSINEAVDVDVVARSIEQMASENAKNAISNAEATRKLNEGMLEAMRAADFGQLANSSSSLERAAAKLDEAAEKIIQNSAGGFVPNFAPNPASRALSTESKMGAKRPVVDSHPSIGSYVRDDATQPNFSAVRRDHPEGINKAVANSAKIQGAAARGFVPNFAKSEGGLSLGELAEQALGKDPKRKRVEEYLADGGKTTMKASKFPGWNSIKTEIYRQTGLGKEDPFASGFTVHLDTPPDYEVLGAGTLGGFDPTTDKLWVSEFPTKDTPRKALAEIQSVLANESIHWIQSHYRKQLGGLDSKEYQQWLANTMQKQDKALGGVGFGSARYAKSFGDIGMGGKAGSYQEFLEGKKFSEEELFKRFDIKQGSIPTLDEMMKMGTPAEAWLLNDLEFYVPRIMDTQAAFWKKVGLTHKKAMGLSEISKSASSGVDRLRTGYLVDTAPTAWPKFRKTGDPRDLQMGPDLLGLELDMFLNDPDFREYWFDKKGNSKFLKDPQGTLKALGEDVDARPLVSFMKDIQSVFKKEGGSGQLGYEALREVFTEQYNMSIAKLLTERMSHMASIGVRNLQKQKGGNEFAPLAGGFIPNFAPIDSASRAISTERAMGAKRPVLDSHPSIGTYVRDDATQSNFAAVKRDHPEGLKQAAKNSRAIQSAANSKGFVPNFVAIPAVIAAWDALTGIEDKSNSWFAEKWKELGPVEQQDITNRGPDPASWFKNAHDGSVSGLAADFSWNLEGALAELTAGGDIAQGIGGASAEFMAAASETPPTSTAIQNFKTKVDEYAKGIEGGEFLSGRKAAAEKHFKNFKVGPKGWIQAGELFSGVNLHQLTSTQDDNIQKIFEDAVWQEGSNYPVDEFIGRYSRTGQEFPPLGSGTDRGSILSKFQNWITQFGDSQGDISAEKLEELFSKRAPINKRMTNRELIFNDIFNKGNFSLRFLESTGGIDEEGIKTKSVLKNGSDSITGANDEQKDIAKKGLLLAAFNQPGNSKGSMWLPEDELIKYGGSKGTKLIEQSRQLDLATEAFFAWDKLNPEFNPTVPWKVDYLMNEDEQIQFDFANTPTQYKSIDKFEDDLKIIDIITPLINENIRRYKKGGDLENAEKLKDSQKNLLKINRAKKSGAEISKYFEAFRSRESFFREPFYLDQKTGKTIKEKGQGLDSLYLRGNYGQFETDAFSEMIAPAGFGLLGERYNETMDEIFSKPSGAPLDNVKKLLDSKLYSPNLVQLATNIHPEATAGAVENQLAEAVKKLEEMKYAMFGIEDIKTQEKRIEAIQKDKKVAETGVKEFLEDKKEKIEIQKEKKATATEEERARLYTALLGGRAGEERADYLGSNPVAAFNERREKAIGVMGRYVQSGGLLDTLKKQRERRLDSLQSNRSTTVQENIPKVQEELDFINSRISLYSNGNEEGIAHLFGIDDDKRYSLVNGKPIHSRVFDANPAKIEEYKKFKSKIKRIQQVTEAEGVMGGEERGGILKKYEKNISKNKEKLLAFAGIQPHIGNSGGPQSGEWIERFKQGTGDDRKTLMSELGLFEESFGDRPFYFVHDLENNFALGDLKGVTDPYSRFYLDELMKADGENDAYLKLVKKVALDIVQNEGIPFFPTGGDLGRVLKGEKLDFLTPGGQVPESISAVDREYVDSLLRNITNIQTKAINEKMAENGGDPDRLLGEILSARKFGDLENNLHYLNYQREQGKQGIVEGKIRKLLNDPSKVENYSDWETFYGKSAPAVIGGLTSNTNYGIPPKWVDAIKNAQEINPDFFGIAGNNNATPFDAAQKVIQGIAHGTNTGIQSLLSENNAYPFPNLHPDKDASGKKSFEDWLYTYVKMATDDPTFSSYAPFGYTKKWQRSAPMANINVLTQFKELINPILKGDKAAGGFIPNFSKVAGEIAASKTAGYKKPVTASQVKSINIPGAGKSTYNTQESVFKARGMSQPFIAPPSNSKAAKPYAKQVQRKFNFNPYGKKSADGFIPNFAPNGSGADFPQMQESVRLFDEATLAFASTVSNFDQIKEASQMIFNGADLFSKQSEALRSSASSFQESADKISQLENQEPIKFEPLTAAVSKIEISFDKLSTNLNKPLEVNSSSIEDSMDNLASAVSNMQANMTVTISDFNVNVNGAAQITDSIRDLLQAQIPQMVQSEISKMKLATKFDIGMN